MKNSVKTEYDIQADDFLAATNSAIKVQYLKTGIYFEGDKDQRDIYGVTISRGSREMKFNFGNSINDSGEVIFLDSYAVKKYGRKFGTRKEAIQAGLTGGDYKKNENYSAPSSYDILTCLTKYNPGSFENFCSEFGYDIDSKRAEKTYHAVVKEYTDLCTLYSDEELQILAEIQ